MKENDIIQVFYRWLKNKNIYHLFLYNIRHYPSSTYTLKYWLAKIKNNISYSLIMRYAPFQMDGAADKALRQHCGENISWYLIIIEWEKYILDNYGRKI